jgi:HEAT repeat protein
MASASFVAVRVAVEILCVIALGMGLATYLSMELRHRLLIARQARRLILASRIPASPNFEKLREVWQRSGRRDRKLLADLLLDLVRLPGGVWEGQALRAISELGIRDGWLRDLKSRRQSVRVQAAIQLSFCRDDESVQALNGAAEDPSRDVALAVVLGLGRLRSAKAVGALIRIASRRDCAVPDLTLAAALAAAAESEPGRLSEMLHARDARLRILGSRALSEVANASVLPDLLESLGDSEPEVRASLCRALAKAGSPQSLEALRKLAEDPVWFVRVRAMDALGRLKDPGAVRTVVTALDDSNPAVRTRAAWALRQIHGMDREWGARIIKEGSRRRAFSLVSEWDRAGWLWEVVAGLLPHDPERAAASREAIARLIEAGLFRALASFLRVYPDREVRLRLLDALLASRRPGLRRELAAIAAEARSPEPIADKINEALRMTDSPLAGAEPRRGS